MSSTKSLASLWGRWVDGNSSESLFEIACDSSGNIYGAGSSTSSSLTSFTGKTTGDTCIIVKYNSSGTLLWGKWLTGFGGTENRGIAVDSEDNIYITGLSAGPFTQANTGLFVTNPGFNMMYVVKMDTNGNVLWVRWAEADTQGRAITVDSNGDIYVGALSYSSVIPGRLGTLLGTKPSSSAGGIVVKYDKNGIEQWAKWYDSTGFDLPFKIRVKNNNIYVVARLEGEAQSEIVNVVGTKPGSTGGGLLLVYSTSGTLTSGRWFDGVSYDEIKDIDFDSSGNIFIIGHTGGNLNSALNAIIGTKPSTGNAGFILKLSPTLIPLWGKWFDGLYDQYGFTVAVDSKDYVYAGVHGNADMIGEIPTTLNLVKPTSYPNFGILITKYDNNGTLLSGIWIDSGGNEENQKIVIDHQDNIILGAYTSGTGPTILGTKPGSGVAAFIIKLTSPPIITYPSTNLTLGINAIMRYLIPTNWGSPITSFAITGTLTTGLSFSTTNGILLGTPTVEESKSHIITVTNSAGSLEIPITITVGKGYWQYTTNNGTTWLALEPSISNALLLASNTTNRVKFVPYENYGGSTSLTIKGWDQSNGTSGSFVTSTTSSSFSSSTAIMNYNITPVNDSPIFRTREYILPSITEGTVSSAPVSAATIIANLNYNDPENDPNGLAILETGPGGIWQRSLNNQETWGNINVSPTSALVMGGVSTYFIRFLPDATFFGTSYLILKAWDKEIGVTSNLVNASVGGGSSAFSTETSIVSIRVTPVNTAPTISGTFIINLTSGTTNPSGTTITTIITGLTYSDVDSFGQRGIAITSANNTNGIWQFSVNGGSSWTVMTVSATSSLLLSDYPINMIRFVPSSGFIGSSSLTIRAWDRSTGTSGATTSTSTNGGTTSFSSSTATITAQVTSSNVAPELNPGYYLLPDIYYDWPNDGVYIPEILSSFYIYNSDAVTIEDENGIANIGMAIINSATSNGTWEVSFDDAVSWTPISTTSTNAYLINNLYQNKIRFVPNSTFEGEASFQFKVWDKSLGQSGTYYTITASGGSTPFSLDESTVSVNASRSLLFQTSIYNVQVDYLVSYLGITDISILANTGIAIIGQNNSNGTWYYSTDYGVTLLELDTSPTNGLLLTNNYENMLQFVPNNNYYSSTTLTIIAWDQSIGTNGDYINITTNPSAFTSQETIVTIDPINQAPTISGEITLTCQSDGYTISSIINEFGIETNNKGLAITSADNTNGIWQYQLNEGDWNNMDNIATSNSLIISSKNNNKIRFIPNNGFIGIVSLQVLAWDSTRGTNASYVNIAATGGITPYSSESGTITIIVE